MRNIFEKEIETCIESIPTVSNSERFIVGIDGLSRSGKTTYTNLLHQKLIEYQMPILVFHMDDFIVERKKRYDTPFDEWYEYYQLQWDVDYLKKVFFSKLKTASQVVLPSYDPDNDDIVQKKMKLPTPCIILIEGVFLQRKEWHKYFDFFIFITSSKDKRFQREHADTKKKIDKFKTRYWIAESYYLENRNPEKHANLVIHN
ncbi:kinase [Salirhabdus sp. Marseille-P4669]|uniref:kinase n=1 Tax=Salirhabdus sp. Marseille-P4669 TaxID=2042310 RepID=UPI000C7B06FF|nr:kinase [Salirhabdus sp. Marseille-P4669]